MTNHSTHIPTHIVFSEHQLLFEGSLAETALLVHGRSVAQQQRTLIFETASGIELDLDLRGSKTEVAKRYPALPNLDAAGAGEPPADAGDEPSPAPRKRGRPKLGVVGREITLLPRHWSWLDEQRGGASAALRRLVDEARKDRAGEDAARAAQDRTQRLVTTLAGNLPGFEEALRALYARDSRAFAEHTGSWPKDVRAIAERFAEPAFQVL